MEQAEKLSEEMGSVVAMDFGAHRHFWISPEILNSKFTSAPTPSCDVYSFGVVLNEIFSREIPYREKIEEVGTEGVSGS